MANQEHLDILKQGVDVWNRWKREMYVDGAPDLDQINLSGVNLAGIHLGKAGLRGANLSNADLSKASLYQTTLTDAKLIEARLLDADLNQADLSEADLNRANLQQADLSEAGLINSNLRGANLSWVDFSSTDLSGADLTGANLREVNFSGAKLANVNLAEARLWRTIFVDVNLGTAKGLESVRHEGPSFIGIESIYHSHGNIPESFLRGAGIPETFITYMRSLVGKPIDYYTCFISYSSKDQAFAERLHADLQDKGVHCWFAPEDLKTGEKFWHRIDESIRLYDKLLVILSKHSVASAWVENEVMAALEKEHKHPNETVLFPIKLDTAVMKTDLPWAANMRRMRHIGDFTKWKNHDDYQKAFNRLYPD